MYCFICNEVIVDELNWINSETYCNSCYNILNPSNITVLKEFYICEDLLDQCCQFAFDFKSYVLSLRAFGKEYYKQGKRYSAYQPTIVNFGSDYILDFNILKRNEE